MFKDKFLAAVEDALTERHDVVFDDITFMTYGEIDDELDFYDDDLDALLIALEDDPIIEEFEQVYNKFIGGDSE